MCMENTSRQSNGNYMAIHNGVVHVFLGRRLFTVLDISEQNTQTHFRYKCLSSTFHLYYVFFHDPAMLCLPYIGRGDSDSATMMLWSCRKGTYIWLICFADCLKEARLASWYKCIQSNAGWVTLYVWRSNLHISTPYHFYVRTFGE